MAPKTWIIKDLLRVSADYLKAKGIESPRLNAEIMLAHQLGKDRVQLYLHFDQPLQEREINEYRGLIRRRVNREPVEYIVGLQEFWSLAFRVGRGVLIPRAESELLVEQVLRFHREGGLTGGGFPVILDLGTGCGALAICLAKKLADATVWATDISEEALAYARLNSSEHGVAERVMFRQGDLWEPLKGQDLTFDVILSNPPYVAAEDYASLPPEVRDCEPRVALDGGEQGTFYIREIIAGATDYLNPGGRLLVEMDPRQTSEIVATLEASDHYEGVRRIRDYSHRYRVVLAKKRKDIA
jgi:release factor glutamine methyltransferase